MALDDNSIPRSMNISFPRCTGWQGQKAGGGMSPRGEEGGRKWSNDFNWGYEKKCFWTNNKTKTLFKY